MGALITVLCLVLLVIVIIQIGRISELAGRIRGEEEIQRESNYWNSRLSVVFMIVFLLACILSAFYYKNLMLGYGPHEAASEHGVVLDRLFDITLFFTGIVFVLTQVALFWYAFKYRGRKGHKAEFMPHDNRLEVVWTAIPAVVMTILVVFGLNAWNEVMADVGPEEDYIEIEATGMQFAWLLRYPGPDGILGERDYRQISGTNPLGQVWEDEANHDDIQPNEIVLPVNKKVRVKIGARDVLHNFYLPHFRVKMDAVPGMPTYFVFTPTKTTADYREELSKYKEYQVPANPEEPEGPQLWEVFDYELACAELCGKGHYSMRKTVRIVTEEEYEEWLNDPAQQSYYLNNIHNTDDDPYKGEFVPAELTMRTEQFVNAVATAIETETTDDDVITLEYLRFEVGSSELDPISESELNNVLTVLQNHPEVDVELAGHTDNSGTTEDNMELSQERAQRVKDYLVERGVDPERLTAVGYGETEPLQSNDTAEGRRENRRTEFRIIKDITNI